MTRAPITAPSDCTHLDDARLLLDRQGWVILAPELIDPIPRLTVERFGRILPQYDGSLHWDVTPKAGFEALPYSQGRQGIGAHTEAPALQLPPRYLVLHCQQQARCGGGHTLLADGLAFCERHVGMARSTSQPIEFVAPPVPGSSTRQVISSPMLSLVDGQPLFRFSDNQFRYGNVNPSAEDLREAGSGGARDADLLRLAELAERYHAEEGLALLVPDGAMLIWDNHRLMHARSRFEDPARHLVRYWLG